MNENKKELNKNEVEKVSGGTNNITIRKKIRGMDPWDRLNSSIRLDRRPGGMISDILGKTEKKQNEAIEKNKKELNENEIEKVSGGLKLPMVRYGEEIIDAQRGVLDSTLISYGGPRCFDKRMEINIKKDEEEPEN